MKTTCPHNQRDRYTEGFRCEDCQQFFSRESPEYRRDEYLSELWMALHNVNAEHPEQAEVTALRDKIGIGKIHENFEDLITEAENLLGRYGSHGRAAVEILEQL